LVDTGRRKFGVIVGDGVHTGIHTSLTPAARSGREFAPVPAKSSRATSPAPEEIAMPRFRLDDYPWDIVDSTAG